MIKKNFFSEWSRFPRFPTPLTSCHYLTFNILSFRYVMNIYLSIMSVFRCKCLFCSKLPLTLLQKAELFKNSVAPRVVGKKAPGLNGPTTQQISPLSTIIHLPP